MLEKISDEATCDMILGSGQVEVRDVDGGEDPFVYSTGNRGPGYLMIKGLGGQPKVMLPLIDQLAIKIAQPYENGEFKIIAGNATGGMQTGWALARALENHLDLERGAIPSPYVRESRKEGGQKELITGIGNNPEIQEGIGVMVVEELVNYAGTTTNTAEIWRSAGFKADHGACILNYGHNESSRRLLNAGVNLTDLVKLGDLLAQGESLGRLSSDQVSSYKSFLANPVDWQLSRGLVVPVGKEDETINKAKELGYETRKLDTNDAISLGAPKSHVEKGVMYFQGVK